MILDEEEHDDDDDDQDDHEPSRLLLLQCLLKRTSINCLHLEPLSCRRREEHDINFAVVATVSWDQRARTPPSHRCQDNHVLVVVSLPPLPRLVALILVCVLIA
ncbi:hypothetical protein Ahy_A01g002981 isoform F [Arachis hypogaea]|uniref:Uncharacterized protein n=1 Tax=Arachis hypogaea TaxID=3818 RepID=A0A445ESD0_ARAHY|nr:hypothetical protein Ahy_A01g002981 isoform F [Arachis hypogaea]